MKKLSSAIVAGGILVNSAAVTLISPVAAFAASELNQKVGIDCNTISQQSAGSVNPACGGDIGKLISTVVTIIFIGAALLALFYLIWGGIRWILSGGDKEATAKARGTLTAAIIGLAIVFLSFVIIKVLGAVFGFDISNLTLPSFNKI